MSILLENPRRRSKRRRSSTRRRKSTSRRRRRNPAAAVPNPRRRRRSRRRKSSSRRRARGRRRSNPFRIPGLGSAGGLMQTATLALAMTAGQYSSVLLASALQKIPGSDKIPWNLKLVLGSLAGGWLVGKFGGPFKKHSKIIAAVGVSNAIYAAMPVGPYQIATKLGLGDYAIDPNYGARADSYGILGTELYGQPLGDWVTQRQLDY